MEIDTPHLRRNVWGYGPWKHVLFFWSLLDLLISFSFIIHFIHSFIHSFVRSFLPSFINSCRWFILIFFNLQWWSNHTCSLGFFFFVLHLRMCKVINQVFVSSKTIRTWLLATVLIHLHLSREKIKINNNCEFKIIFYVIANFVSVSRISKRWFRWFPLGVRYTTDLGPLITILSLHNTAYPVVDLLPYPPPPSYDSMICVKNFIKQGWFQLFPPI